MPKILIIDQCEECKNCRIIDMVDECKYWCRKEYKEIPNSEEIPEWCPLPNSCEHGGSEYTEWINGKEVWKCCHCDEEITPKLLPNKEAEITGIPCSHVAPEGVCEKCGEEVKDY